MRFEKVDPREIPLETMEWLKPIESVKKVVFDHMVHMIFSHKWDLRALPKPASGAAVTYPFEGKLFIYYLRGRGLFSSLNREDLLQAARDDGLTGVMAETSNPATLRLLLKVGFKPIDSGPFGTVVELQDG
jgi:hypothetical protein